MLEKEVEDSLIFEKARQKTEKNEKNWKKKAKN